MERTRIGYLRQAIEETVKIEGWLQTLRDQKKMQFLILRDLTGAAQMVFEKKQDPELASLISSLNAETALTITGTVIENPIVKLNGLEVQLETLVVEGSSEAPLALDPFAEAMPAINHRLDWRYLDLRRPENLLIFQVQTTVEMAVREYWIRNDIIEIHSPKLMGSPSESGAELFELSYFDREAYLAQSPQFYKQMAMAAWFERVFEIGPVFRADPSFTSRHMTEFTSVDMEMSWISSHEDVMAFMEGWLNYVCQCVAEEHAEAIRQHYGIEITPPATPFPSLTMDEAQVILDERGYQLPPDRKGDLDPGGEQEIGRWVQEHFGHDYVFLTDWPVGVRPFYHMRYSDHPGQTEGFDLLARGLELATGAQREHRYDVLARQALEKGLHLEPIQFYLDFFRYGCPQHGGFGFGLGRFLMILLGLTNIREAVFLFRGPTRLQP
jgi:nondiscriminating aspartyl-tRNA synthetase